MTESIYKEYENKYYNPNDNDKKPGDNDNWKSIQKGFHDIGATQLETSAGLTLGKGTEDETSVTAAELEEMKSGGGNCDIKFIKLDTKDVSIPANSSIEWAFDSVSLERINAFLTANYPTYKTFAFMPGSIDGPYSSKKGLDVENVVMTNGSQTRFMNILTGDGAFQSPITGGYITIVNRSSTAGNISASMFIVVFCLREA